MTIPSLRLLVAISVAVTVVLAGWPAGAVDTWKLANATAPGDRQDVATQRFVDIVNKRFEGRIAINYFKASQLGNERELTEGVKLGTIELGMTSTSAMTTFVPQLAFYDLPFLFRDKAHARQVATGPVGRTPRPSPGGRLRTRTESPARTAPGSRR